jgi:hypothetical protein
MGITRSHPKNGIDFEATKGMVSRKGEGCRPGARKVRSAPNASGKSTTSPGATRRALTKNQLPCRVSIHGSFRSVTF